MSDITINNLPTASTIDATADYLPIYTASALATQKITRNTYLGLSSAPVGLTDSQTLTNKILTAPTLSSPVLSGTITGTYTIGGTPTFPSSVVTLTGSQTLTNKILTSPTINSPTITNATLSADTITGFSSSTTGIIYGVPITSSLIPGTNIANASITTAQISSSTITASNINFGGSGSGIWWQEIGRTTLSGASNTITVSSLTTMKYLCLKISLSATGGTIRAGLLFNNDSGANYSGRQSTNGAADTTSASASVIQMDSGAGAYPMFFVVDILNIQAQEKLVMSWSGEQNTAGATNVPSRREAMYKWSNTSVQITRIDLTNIGTGNFAIGSEIIVLGHN